MSEDNQEIKTTYARLHIQVLVECPNCFSDLDLMDSDDTSGSDHNEEGQVLNQACPNGHWSEKHEHFNIDKVKCSQCNTKFNIKGLEW